MSYTTSRPPPGDLSGLRQFIADELAAIGRESLEPAPRSIRLKQLNVVPSKLYNGLTAYADGTNWNPAGGGEGVYTYYAGAWHKLG